jgi:hypothetical protein
LVAKLGIRIHVKSTGIVRQIPDVMNVATRRQTQGVAVPLTQQRYNEWTVPKDANLTAGA